MMQTLIKLRETFQQSFATTLTICSRRKSGTERIKSWIFFLLFSITTLPIIGHAQTLISYGSTSLLSGPAFPGLLLDYIGLIIWVHIATYTLYYAVRGNGVRHLHLRYVPKIIIIYTLLPYLIITCILDLTANALGVFGQPMASFICVVISLILTCIFTLLGLICIGRNLYFHRTVKEGGDLSLKNNLLAVHLIGWPYLILSFVIFYILLLMLSRMCPITIGTFPLGLVLYLFLVPILSVWCLTYYTILADTK